MVMERFAHSLEGHPETDWEPLSYHLSRVGKRAAEFASVFGASTVALAMGLLHDIGKCSQAYQLYIRRPGGRAGPKGPDHSSAGAKEALKLYGSSIDRRTIGRLMAFGLAGHHSGLMDGSGYEGRGASLDVRCEKVVEAYDGWEAHVTGLPQPDELKQSLRPLKPNGIAPGFQVSFFTRMLFSCLVDADFLETEAFREKKRLPRGGVIGSHHQELVRTYMARHRREDTEVNRLRSAILDHATNKAALSPGLFTLTVPTGGGKTLTSLSFALEHALRHDLRRIIYVIPFTSIIEQTAQVFRKDVGLGDAVLEHHSSFDWDQEKPSSDDEEEEGAAGLAKLRRDAENWDSPIVVTTAVQFFESLYAARTSRARKLHNLAKSVIILDEAQSIPVKLLRPCMAAIEELANNYGASVILCTATQPALRRQDGALPARKSNAPEGLDIPDERELAPDPKGLYKKLKRVEVEWRRSPTSDEEIAARFAASPQMLCIVNSRAHARDLFEAIRHLEGAVHLTTLMHARHRRDVLATIKDRLAARLPVRLVATSLIEAGVDVSFPEVWRAAAGLSSIAQAAGRCNREGELTEPGRTIVFEPAQHKTPAMIDAFYGPARQVLRREGIDVLGLDAINDYYRELYWRQGYEALDAVEMPAAPKAILRTLAMATPTFDFPFARIAEAFRMIDDVMKPVIVPLDEEARKAIEAIRKMEFPPADVRRKLQQYVVPVPAQAREMLLSSGAVQAIRPKDYGDRFAVLENLSLYDPKLGLRLDDPTWRSSESNIIG